MPTLFESDPLCDDSCLDNLSISIDNIYAILDEDPDPDPLLLRRGGNNNTPGTSEVFYQGELAPGRVDHANAFKPKAEPSTVLEDFIEHSKWNLEHSDCKREMEFDFLFNSEVGFNNFTDNGSFSTSQHFDSKSSHPFPSQQSSDCLTLSYSNNNDLMGAFRDPSGSYFTSHFDHQQMLNNIPQYGIQSAKAVGLTSLSNDENGSYISETENKLDCEKLQGEVYFQSEDESKPDVNKLSPLCNLQNRGAGSSHCGLVKNSIFCGDLHSSKAGALLISAVEDRNTLPSMHSHMNTDAPLTDQVHIEANTFQLTSMTCDGSNSLTVPRVSPPGVEFGIDQMKSAYFHPLLSCGYESTDVKGYQLLSHNSCRTSEVKLGAQEGSPGSSFPEVSIIDLDASLPDEDQDYSEDTSLISDSSTDSSPIPSSRNFGPVSADRHAVNASEKLVSDPKIIVLSKNPKSEIKNVRGDQLLASSYKQHGVPKGGDPTVLRNPRRGNLETEDVSDVCILNHINDPAIPAGLLARRKLLPVSKYSGFRDRHSGISSMRLKPEDERSTVQIALQDLSQPISEASPPDGFLAVPLLRHQRIALSWMVNKETANMRCTGGILADDQGLGKTISTIALILQERSPSSKFCSVLEKQDECDALNLDDDEVSVMKQSRNSMPYVMSRPIKEHSVGVMKGRPQAGTLVVCPTSVLRQWAEELQTKVTSKANLSFLVYYGGNRTKDPNELAKYDVVLTTYAIVSMEVPKQPLVDKDDDRGKKEASCVLDDQLRSKKRKISNSKCRNSMMLETGALPLARVGWFRVVLDEAQSIKNHRTQVARACWGLRAKRRWCLSGTPIQNAIDDLYSYFRFLRFEQLEKYHSFCSSIKVPINKDPPNGYKRLRAVLKMIMLRRTKGTLLDGKPIINLPAKTISLKKVKFSNEERNFYMKLEAESQEQFKVYADAGTVKQNYVNILLMLLRLRQACDHCLLVKGCGSVSNRNASLETAKKLSRDKKINLLSCLEASLAICTICNDAPEDSVVTVCGHVFCNQCICERLTGDEYTCPSPNCKVQLSAASFFSRGTLKSSLPDQLGHDSDSPGFEVKDEHNNTCEDGLAYPLSSKLKAALEILQSLPKYQGSSKGISEKSNGGLQDSLANSLNTDSLRTSVDLSGVKHMNLDKCSDSRVSEKAIVFSQWTGMLDLLENSLRASSIQYRRLDGTMSVASRERAVKDFNTLPQVTVIIMSLKAASLGLNMVAACHVLLLDLWWNPTTEDQAIDRAHRIGQTRPVTVSRLTVEHTVEDRILRLQQKKREIVSSAFGEDDSGTRQSRLTEEDLRYLFMV